MASTHGSPWRYDTYMPVMFAGSGLKGIAFDRQVTSHDIAAMQASYLGIKPPKASIGDLLAEVVGSKADE